jgi:hypothetical protein
MLPEWAEEMTEEQLTAYLLDGNDGCVDDYPEHDWTPGSGECRRCGADLSSWEATDDDRMSDPHDRRPHPDGE